MMHLHFEVLVDNAQQKPQLGSLQEGHKQLKRVGGKCDWVPRRSGC